MKAPSWHEPSRAPLLIALLALLAPAPADARLFTSEPHEGSASGRTAFHQQSGCPARRASCVGVQFRVAESRDRTIDYRGTYWFEPETPRAVPASQPDRPIMNFLADPDSPKYEDWGQQTFFDRNKRLAPISAENDRRRKPGVTFFRLRF